MQTQHRFVAITVILVSFLLGCSLPGIAPGGSRSSYPEKPITMVVGYDAGGATDLVARSLGEAAKGSLGQPIVILNRPGGGGTIGAAEVVRAKPDGYTIGMAGPSTMMIEPNRTELPYKGPSDYRPISNIVDVVHVLAVRTDTPWKTLKELVDYAKANPGKIRVGSSQVGSIAFIDLKELNALAGADMTLVPEGSSANTLTAFLGGHLEAAAFSPPVILPHVQAGKARLLATFEENRNPLYPEVPTVRELGYDVSHVSFLFVFTPKGTPDGVVQTLDRAFKQATETASFKPGTGNILRYQGPTELERRLEREYAFYGEMVQKLGLKQ